MKATGQVILLADRHDPPSRPTGTFRFVGRARELDLLLAAARHPPGIVLVEGEAGIGKSRLVREATTALGRENRCVLVGYCHPLREPLPYGPVVDALQKAGPWLPTAGLPPTAEALARLLPDLADRMPHALPRPEDPQAERLQLVQAVRSFLASLGPTVLIVEDVHWVDQATRDLLLLLARDLPEQLCLVLTYRAEDLPLDTPVLGAAYRRPPGTSGTVLRLGPLDEADIRELASAALGDRATSDLVDSLHRRSEGLPLVAEEDLITLREHGFGHGEDDPAARLRDADVPRGLREAVTERLTRLTPQATAVVAASAVLAVPATEQLLGEVAGLDAEEGADGLVEALEASLLRETDDGRYAFRHALARRVAHRRLPTPTRRRLHASAIAVLERQNPPPLVQIAYHTLELGDRDAWLGRAEQAADQAVGVGDVGTASALLMRMLEQPDIDPEARSRAALRLAGLATHAVDFTAHAAVLRTILADRQLSPATRGEIRVGLGGLLLNQASDRTGFDELARAVDELGETSPKALSAMIALALNESGDADEAQAWMARAERVVADVPEGPLTAAVRATRLTLRCWAGDPGVWAAVEELPRQGSDLAVLRQTARALYNVGDGAIDLGEDRRVRALIDESLAVGRTAGFPILELNAQLDLLRLDALAGRWDGLRQRFDALALAHPDALMVSAERSLFLGIVGLAQGQRSRAAQHFAQAADLGGRHFALTLVGRAAAGWAAVLLAQGDARGASTVAENGLAAVRRAHAWPKGLGLVPIAAGAALACGERALAERLAEEVAEGLEGRVTPAATAELHGVRGHLLLEPAPDQAAREYAASVRLWEEMGRPYYAARSAEAQARALAGLGPERAEEAAAVLASVTDAYAALGATADLARVRHLTQQLGIARPPQPGRRGYGNELSPREQEVAELLAKGATNQEIAEVLFLSPRTVEHHVASVLKKLGTTRKGVPAAVAEASSTAGGSRGQA